MDWNPLTEPPIESGTYIVGHRGHQKIIKFLAVEDPQRNTRCGWQSDPRMFKATHWAKVEGIPDTDGPRDGYTDYRVGDIIVVERPCLAAIYETHSYRTVFPVKFGPFRWNRPGTHTYQRVKNFVPVAKGTLGSITKVTGHHDDWCVWAILNDSGREVAFNPTIGYNFTKYESPEAS